MKFKMNNTEFEIKEVSEEELWGDTSDERKYGVHYYGRFSGHSANILICKTLGKNQKRKTLIHELTHCYIFSYCTDLEQCIEEDICNIHMNSHDIIHKIVEDYFKGAK